MYLYCKWQIVLFHIFCLSSIAVKLMKGERTVDNTCQKRCNDSQQSFKNFEYSLQTCSVLCCLHMPVSKPQKISKTPLNNYTSIVHWTEYCSQVSRFIQTGFTVNCIMFSLKSSRQIHAITLNQATTTLFSSLMIHIALVNPVTVYCTI